MIDLYFKKRELSVARGPHTIDIAKRSSNCVPRPGEYVCLAGDDAAFLVVRVEYIMLEAPEQHYNEQVWVWVA